LTSASAQRRHGPRAVPATVSRILPRPTGPFPALLLLAGIGLGPHGLALLTPAILDFLDPAAPVALAALGVITGFDLRTSRIDWRVRAAAHMQATLTGLFVAAAFVVFRPAIDAAAFPPWRLVALALAIAAATSSSLPSDAEERTSHFSTRLDVDYLLPIAAGGAALAFIRTASPAASVVLLAETIAIAVVIAVGGWLLLSRNGETTEQRVFAFASLLLLGGAADYLSASALLSGLVAGACWQWAGGPVGEYVRRDVAYVQHSLVVLILLLAGAHADFSPAALLMSTIYVVVRTTGKLTGGWLASWVAPDVSRSARLRLISPGVFGVAFALNLARAGGPGFGPVLTVVGGHHRVLAHGRIHVGGAHRMVRRVAAFAVAVGVVVSVRAIGAQGGAVRGNRAGAFTLIGAWVTATSFAASGCRA
jgi:hypothetical protein